MNVGVISLQGNANQSQARGPSPKIERFTHGEEYFQYGGWGWEINLGLK